MLNRLLKKCMPWQQRGKWIRIYYDGSSAAETQEVTFRVPDEMTFAISEDGWGFNVTFDRPTIIAQSHMTVTHVTSDFVPEGNAINIEVSPGYMVGTKGYIDMYITKPEVI